MQVSKDREREIKAHRKARRMIDDILRKYESSFDSKKREKDFQFEGENTPNGGPSSWYRGWRVQIWQILESSNQVAKYSNLMKAADLCLCCGEYRKNYVIVKG